MKQCNCSEVLGREVKGLRAEIFALKLLISDQQELYKHACEEIRWLKIRMVHKENPDLSLRQVEKLWPLLIKQ